MLGRAFAKVEPHPTRQKLLKKLQIQWEQISQQAIQKIFLSMRRLHECTTKRDGHPHFWYHLCYFFFMHPYLNELIRGADMDMMLNHFCVFLYPNTPNFTRHKIYIFICVFKKTKLMSIFQTFVPQYMI